MCFVLIEIEMDLLLATTKTEHELKCNKNMSLLQPIVPVFSILIHDGKHDYTRFGKSNSNGLVYEFDIHLILQNKKK
jgi:hypothetical protein